MERGALNAPESSRRARRYGLCVSVPGGFSYGDYLRCGGIARFSPMIQAVKQFADNDGVVLGRARQMDFRKHLRRAQEQKAVVAA